MTSLSSLTVDELADGICLRAGRIAAAQAELLTWIAKFDRREGWGGPGLLSCAHWLSWRIGLSLGTANEYVRVAHRLEELPELAAAFAEGRVSYSKARAITRVATADDGVDWVALARHSSAAQLEKIVRGVARAKANEAAQADPEQSAWKVRTRKRYDREGNLVITITARPEYAPVVEAGLDAKRAELQRELDAQAVETVAGEAVPAPPNAGNDLLPFRDASAEPSAAVTTRVAPAEPADDADPDADPTADLEADLDEQAPDWPAGTTRRQVRQALDAVSARWAGTATSDEPLPTTAPWQKQPDVPAEAPARPRATDGDALLALAQDALAAEKQAHPDIARRRRPGLTAQVDPLSGWARQPDGELLPPPNLRAVMKTLPGRGGAIRLRPVTDADLRRFDLGRTQREASAKLRELLGILDGERCRFPGCTRVKKLHAHHVLFWRDGGATDLSNLVLVCARHHTLIHAQGFQLVLHPDRRLEVRTADGVPVLHHPAQPWGDAAALAEGCGQLVSAETLQPDHCDARLDLHYVVSVVLAQAA
ncbi:MAG TPA: DUF222 domain-containing protein [Mycobacteriales bacterium]|nr:DUF222 domain-containing protein [Mycobacteriales bacterium]